VFFVGHLDKSSLYETLFHCNILTKHHHYHYVVSEFSPRNHRNSVSSKNSAFTPPAPTSSPKVKTWFPQFDNNEALIQIEERRKIIPVSKHCKYTIADEKPRPSSLPIALANESQPPIQRSAVLSAKLRKKEGDYQSLTPRGHSVGGGAGGYGSGYHIQKKNNHLNSSSLGGIEERMDKGSDRGSGRFNVSKSGFEKINAQKIPVFMRSAFEGIEEEGGNKIMEHGIQKDGSQKDGFQKDYQTLTSKEQRDISSAVRTFSPQKGGDVQRGRSDASFLTVDSACMSEMSTITAHHTWPDNRKISGPGRRVTGSGNVSGFEPALRRGSGGAKAVKRGSGSIEPWGSGPFGPLHLSGSGLKDPDSGTRKKRSYSHPDEKIDIMKLNSDRKVIQIEKTKSLSQSKLKPYNIENINNTNSISPGHGGPAVSGGRILNEILSVETKEILHQAVSRPFKALSPKSKKSTIFNPRDFSAGLPSGKLSPGMIVPIPTDSPAPAVELPVDISVSDLPVLGSVRSRQNSDDNSENYLALLGVDYIRTSDADDNSSRMLSRLKDRYNDR
jgi:hypothetical protein